MDVEYLEEYEDVLKTCRLEDSGPNKPGMQNECETSAVLSGGGATKNATSIRRTNKKNKSKTLTHKSTDKSAVIEERLNQIAMESKNKFKSPRKHIRNNKVIDYCKLAKIKRKTKGSRVGKIKTLNEKRKIPMKNKNVAKSRTSFDNSSQIVDGKSTQSVNYKTPKRVNTTSTIESTCKTSDLFKDNASDKSSSTYSKFTSNSDKFELLAENPSEKIVTSAERITQGPVKEKKKVGRPRKNVEKDLIVDGVTKKDSVMTKLGRTTNVISKPVMERNKIKKLKIVLKRLNIANDSKVKNIAEKPKETNISAKDSENKNCGATHEKINNGDGKYLKQSKHHNSIGNTPKLYKLSHEEQHKRSRKTVKRNSKKVEPNKVLGKEIGQKSKKLKLNSQQKMPSLRKIIPQTIKNQSHSKSSTKSKELQTSPGDSNNFIFYEVPAYIFVETKILTRADYQKLKNINGVEKQQDVNNTQPKSQTALSSRVDSRNLEIILDDIEAIIDKEISRQVKEKLQRISEGFSCSSSTAIVQQKRKDKGAILENLHFESDILQKVLRFLKIYFSATANVDKEEEEKASTQQPKNVYSNSNLSSIEYARESYALNSETCITKVSVCETINGSNNSPSTEKRTNEKSSEFEFRKIRLPNKDNLNANQNCKQNALSTNTQRDNLQTLPKIVTADVSGKEETILPDIFQQENNTLRMNSTNILHDLTEKSLSSTTSVKSVTLSPNPNMKTKSNSSSTQISKFHQLQSKPKQMILQKPHLKQLSGQKDTSIPEIISKLPPVLAVAPIISSIEKSNGRLIEDELIIPDEYVESGSKTAPLPSEINLQENQLKLSGVATSFYH